MLDRTKEPGALGEPLYMDVVTALANAGVQATVIGGRYGLGSKDTPPASIFAVYNVTDNGNTVVKADANCIVEGDHILVYDVDGRNVAPYTVIYVIDKDIPYTVAP